MSSIGSTPRPASTYQAIRARDAESARRAMHDHLMQARQYQAQEAGERARATRRSRTARPARQTPRASRGKRSA